MQCLLQIDVIHKTSKYIDILVASKKHKYVVIVTKKIILQLLTISVACMKNVNVLIIISIHVDSLLFSMK